MLQQFEDLDRSVSTIVSALERGELVPFLGAGANLCGRADGQAFSAGELRYLPSGAELSRYLAAEFRLANTESDDLVTTAQMISMARGPGPIYRALRKLFNADWPPTPLHDLLARLPRILAANGWKPIQLIVTTNYDDLLERAFRAAGTDVDVVMYMAQERHHGMFVHIPPEGSAEPITDAAAYAGFAEDDNGDLKRPVILKLHGAIDRLGSGLDSWVITEDDYIAYLSKLDVSRILPKQLVAKLMWSHFLFLGYSLRDWNVRAILHRISQARAGMRYDSWAVQKNPDELEQMSWQHRGVKIIGATLDDYVATLSAELNRAVGSGSEGG
jgi:hypothetical protein